MQIDAAIRSQCDILIGDVWVCGAVKYGVAEGFANVYHDKSKSENTNIKHLWLEEVKLGTGNQLPIRKVLAPTEGVLSFLRSVALPKLRNIQGCRLG
jgi:hypothetical protein